MTGTTAQDKHFTGAARMICFARKEAIFRSHQKYSEKFFRIASEKSK